MRLVFKHHDEASLSSAEETPTLRHQQPERETILSRKLRLVAETERERRFSQEVSGDATLVVCPLLEEGVVIFLIVNYISTPPPLLSLAQIREHPPASERGYLCPSHYLY